MNQPNKPAANGEFVSPTAPSAAIHGACEVRGAATTAENAGKGFLPRPTNDLSARKNRFMTALLDKLKVNGKARAAAESEARSERDLLAEAQTGAAESFPQDTPISSDAPDDGQRWLDETRASDAGYSRPMTFTYPPGSTPLPRYTIRRGIGMGGFGEVYFAISEAGKEVALKRIQRNLEVELRGVSHCLNLKHPNLVSLYDICRDSSDQSWVVMEYVAGPNLREVLDLSPDGLPPAEVCRWFTAIASGVNHLHSAGLVHRDLKPGNVFNDLGIIKVGDYGLSKFISASHRGGHTESVGTFHYMAPEIRARPVWTRDRYLCPRHHAV